MRKLIIALLLTLCVGCASTLTIHPDGSMVAKDYTVTIKADGTRVYAPNRWFNTSFITKFFSQLLGIVSK